MLAGLPLVVLGQSSTLTIVRQPLSVSNATVGAQISFFVKGQSTLANPIYQYQWRLNGINIPGATNETYTNTVQATNCGAYTAAVTDGASLVISATASLTANILELLTGGILNQIGITNGVIRSSNVGLSATVIPIILPNNTGGHPAVFKWTPLFSGIATFSTAGSDFETILGAFTGSASNPQPVPSCVNADDTTGFHNSRISFNAQGLTEYLIIVDGYNGASGNIVLSWSENVSSARLATFSSLLQPESIAGNEAAFSFTTKYDAGSLLWYFNGAPTTVSSARLDIVSVTDATVGTYFAAVTSPTGVATATRGADLQAGVLEDGTVPVDSFAWKHFSDAAKAPYIQPVPQGARKLSGGGDNRGFSVSQTFSTVGAVPEPGEPVLGNQIGGAPEWYVYVTPTNGTMEIDTAGSSFNTILGAFIGPGTSFLTLTNQGYGYTTNYAATGQPQIVFTNVPIHQTNYILVEGENGASGTVHLHINMGFPIITNQPRSQEVAAGGTASFTNLAAGLAPLAYQWWNGNAPISDATNSTLTLNSVSTNQAGNYSCIVTNAVGAVTSTVVNLTVDALPVITLPPLSQTVALNSVVTLSVTSSSVPSPSFAWYFDGLDAGVTSNLLTLPNFQPAQQGTYFVVVSNRVGAVTSAPAYLALNLPLRAGQTLLTNGLFQFQFIGSAGSNYVIQTSTDLTTWIPLFTNTATNGYISVTDSNAAHLPGRFYRTEGQ